MARPARAIFRGRYRLLLDAAHNPDGAAALADYLAGSEWRDATLVFAAMQDKAVDAMLAPLAAVCATVICTALPLPRALPADALARSRAPFLVRGGR
jgi:dihydrofolate synthase/folylpolyglutamate synthase